MILDGITNAAGVKISVSIVLKASPKTMEDANAPHQPTTLLPTIISLPITSILKPIARGISPNIVVAVVSKIGLNLCLQVLITTSSLDKFGEYRPDDSKDEIEIRARFSSKMRSLSGVEDLKVNSINGLIPISTFIKLVPTENRQSVVRRNGKFFHEIGLATASSDFLVSAKVQEMREWISTQEFEKGITTKFRGMQEETEEVTEFLGVAALTALALMLILLVTQFNSFYQSTLVLSAVFMSVVGVLIGLLITGKPFSTTMTGIAIVALSGIVVNNNIVLIDTFNRLKEEFPNLSREDVVIKTCKQRLRPILLTTATTIFGLMPLAMGLSIDVIGREIIVGSRVVGWWGALASSIVFGLAFSTILTLIFTPAALVIPSRIKAWLQNRYDLFKATS